MMYTHNAGKIATATTLSSEQDIDAGQQIMGDGSSRPTLVIRFDLKKLQSEEMPSKYVGTSDEQILQTLERHQDANSFDGE